VGVFPSVWSLRTSSASGHRMKRRAMGRHCPTGMMVGVDIFVHRRRPQNERSSFDAERSPFGFVRTGTIERCKRTSRQPHMSKTLERSTNGLDCPWLPPKPIVSDRINRQHSARLRPPPVIHTVGHKHAKRTDIDFRSLPCFIP
jgi:hypothetical protein